MLKRIIETGTSIDQPPQKNKKTRLLNSFFLLRIALSIPFILEDFFIPRFPFIYSVLIHGGVITYISSLFLLQKKGKYDISCILFLLLIYTELYFFSYVLQQNSGTENFYLVFPLVSLIFFDNKWINHAFLALAMGLFFIPKVVNPALTNGELPFSTIGLFITIYVIVVYFKNQNIKSEIALKNQRNTALADKQTIAKQKTELETINQYQQRFFRNIAHEIRTPLTIIRGNLFFIKNAQEEKSKIADQLTKLENMVSDVLDLFKMNSQQYSPKLVSCSISDLIYKCFTWFEPAFQKKEIEFQLEDQTSKNLMVNADQVNLERALNNLINNALRFTSEGGKVAIIVKEIKNTIEINVQDNGIGIPESDQELVFNDFYQSDNKINDAGGSGVGLSFAKYILNLHNGKIQLSSKVGKGSIFTISLPISGIDNSKQDTINSEEIENPLEVPTKSNSSINILIVEDQEEISHMISNILDDYTCYFAENGKKAIESMNNQSYSLLIVDYMMPEMNGIDFIKHLKENNTRIPIIALTAIAETEVKSELLQLGVDDFLLKPFDPMELKVRVNNQIENDRKRLAYLLDVPIEEDFHLDLIGQVKSFVWDHHDIGSVSTSMLSNHFALSPSSLYRKIKSATGLGTKDFITELRLLKASAIKEHQPDITIKQLAKTVGWRNQTRFAQQFKDRFGRSL